MLTRILVKIFFGGVWKLKDKCNAAKFKPLKNFLINVYKARQFVEGGSIPFNTHFDGPPYLPHGIKGVFISAASRIGKNCIIFQQVTIGTNHLVDSKNIGAPVIGDNCIIGAGAKIIGNVKIGNNVRIGANCVVTADVPDNSLVIASAQNVISREKEQNNRFYAYDSKWSYFEDGYWIEERDPEVIKTLEFTKKSYTY